MHNVLVYIGSSWDESDTKGLSTSSKIKSKSTNKPFSCAVVVIDEHPRGTDAYNPLWAFMFSEYTDNLECKK